MTRALALVPAVLLLAGCGTSPSSSEGTGPTTSDASTSHVEFTTIDSAPEWGLTAVGVIDYANNEGDLVFKSKGGGPGEMHAMFIGRETYLGAVIDGKMRWEKESAQHDERPSGAERFLPGPGGTKPDAVLAALRDASTNVERLGEEKVRDVQTIHYKAHLKRPSPEGAVEAWIDENGLARRIRVTHETAEFYDYGVQADIEAPSADEVLTEEEFDKLMTKECSKTKEEKSIPVWCLFFGDSDSTSVGGGEITPTETMPTTTTEGK